ncbi:hypothetical protein NB717_003811 [Xanthomonas sacchari]|nr:hypothetical protein [Xanthomonas sacchari]MCW0462743.1 hypothetical protein [Xanthomonas sacchari]
MALKPMSAHTGVCWPISDQAARAVSGSRSMGTNRKIVAMQARLSMPSNVAKTLAISSAWP